MAGGSYIITVNPGTSPDTGTALCPAFRAGTIYGGVTIVDAWVSTGISASTLDIALVNFGTTGTVSGATIAHMASGTATVWTADVPQSLTITPANAYVDAGEYVFVKKIESAAAQDLSEDASVCIEVVNGMITQA